MCHSTLDLRVIKKKKKDLGVAADTVAEPVGNVLRGDAEGALDLRVIKKKKKEGALDLRVIKKKKTLDLRVTKKKKKDLGVAADTVEEPVGNVLRGDAEGGAVLHEF